MAKNALIATPTLFEKLLGSKTTTGKIILTLLYAAIACLLLSEVVHYYIPAHGDEYFYVDYANAIGTNGLYHEMSVGNPVGYTIFVYLISNLGISPLISGRIIALIATVAFYFGLRRLARNIFDLEGPFLELGLLTCVLGILASHYFFITCPDMLYYMFLVWAINYTWAVINKWSWQSFALAGAFLSLTILVRPLTLIFFAGIVAAMVYYSFFAKVSLLKKISCILAFVLSFLIVFVAQQYPALKNQGSFAFERKIHKKDAKSNWYQRATLNNLKREKGEKITTGDTYPSWDEVDAYLAKNGSKSLPAGAVERVTWNPSYFVKYYIKGASMVIRDFFRNSGFLFLLPLIVLFRPKFPQYSKYAFFAIFALVYFAVYLFATLNMEEVRHILIPLVLMALAGAAILGEAIGEGKKFAVPVLYIQVAAVLIILLLDIKFFAAEFFSPSMI